MCVFKTLVCVTNYEKEKHSQMTLSNNSAFLDSAWCKYFSTKYRNSSPEVFLGKGVLQRY